MAGDRMSFTSTERRVRKPQPDHGMKHWRERQNSSKMGHVTRGDYIGSGDTTMSKKRG